MVKFTKMYLRVIDQLERARVVDKNIGLCAAIKLSREIKI